MSVSTQGAAYLLSTIEFDVGQQHVTLYGALKATPDELTVELAKDLPFAAEFGGAPATTSIAAPFGMTGVTLDTFDLQGTLRKGTAQKMQIDLVLSASASLRGLGLSLAGALIFEDSSPRLALVQLAAQPPLTLTQLVQKVLGSTWAWADGVTDGFAFTAGRMYYLKAPANAADGYTFAYALPGQSAQTYAAGYHLDATLRLFGQDFDVDVAVTEVPKSDGPPGTAIDVKTTLLRDIDFDIVTFNQPNVEISDHPDSTYFRLATGLTIFGSTGSLSATYASKQFGGSVGIEGFEIDFTWGQSGFALTNIGGLERFSKDLDLLEQYYKVFNELKSGGCEKIVTGWLDDMKKSTFTPKFRGAPTKDPGNAGWMTLPLSLTYSVVGVSATMDFDAYLQIPHGLSNLPQSIFDSLVTSAEKIATAILSDPQTYKAIALYIAQKVGAQALARFICRALQEFAEQIAKDLAEAAGEVVADSLVAAAELAAQLAMVALLDLPAVIGGLLGVLEKIVDDIKKAFGGGGDDGEKQRAIDAVTEQVRKVQDAVALVADKIAQAQHHRVSDTLKVKRAGPDFLATWRIDDFAPGSGDSGEVHLVLQLQDGLPARADGTHGTPNAPVRWTSPDLPAGNPELRLPLTSIPDYQTFRLNAQIYAVVTGIEFLNQTQHDKLTDAVNQLYGPDISEINAQADNLKTAVEKLWAYNAGIATDPIHAVLDMPLMTVGQSIVGLNTVISA